MSWQHPGDDLAAKRTVSAGVWGYLEMVHELQQQVEGQGFTDIAMVSWVYSFSCGEGRWGAEC